MPCKHCKQCGGRVGMPKEYYSGQSSGRYISRGMPKASHAYGANASVSQGVSTPNLPGFVGPNLAHMGPGVNVGFQGGARKLKRKRKRTKRVSGTTSKRKRKRRTKKK